MTHPHMTDHEARSHQTFTALMWALSQPGQSFGLPGRGLAAFGAIAEALLDIEASYYSDDPHLQALLARTGARARPQHAAMYQFYPRLAADPAALRTAPAGTYAYPDESATLVLGCAFGAGNGLRLRGPGIASVADLWIDEIPAAFWELREQICAYPLGWDVLLVAGDRVIGLPRTTKIEVE